MKTLYPHDIVTAQKPNLGEVDGPVTRWASKLIDFWNRPILRSHTSVPLLALSLAALCLIRAFIGLWGMKVYTHDAFTVVSGAWRIMNGQRPHIDFYTGLGPVAYLQCALGLMLAHGIAGYAYAQAAVGFLLGLWTYSIARRRVGDVATTALCFVVVLLTVTPTITGYSPQVLTPASFYNRYGYSLIAILLIEALCQHRDERSSRAPLLGGFSTGAVIALLLFLKISILR